MPVGQVDAQELPRRVPVTVLTGFLGAGKTTLLNRILTENHGKKIAVIENEFGEVGIDNALVIGADEEIFEMNNGCICCTVRGDLIRILGNLMRRRDKLDAILIETTGLADPAPVAQTFFVDEEMKDQLRLDGIVTLVDSKHVALHLGGSKECQEQIAFADVILLNKTDLVTAEELDLLERRIRSMNAMARIHRTKNTAIALDKVLDVGGFDLSRALDTRPAFLEPEYPFEWSGIYSLDAGEHLLTLQDGSPDPSMDLLLLRLSDGSEQAMATALDRATRLISETRAQPTTGGELRPESLHRISLAPKGEKRVTVQVSEPGVFVLFTQHMPAEFSMRLQRGRADIRPTSTHQYNPGHEHDNSVTSVSIVVEGDLHQEKLNRWLSKLLQESGSDIFRMKGILSIAGQDRRFVFQGVHMLFDGEPERPWGKEERSNQMVFIGRNLDSAALDRGFRACLA